MSTYRVTDSDGNVGRIIASEEFAKAHYVSYELEPLRTKSDSEIAQEEKVWRDRELKETDWIVAVTDHPQLAAYKTYRQELRDWPSTEDFPNTKPTLGS